MIDLHCHVMPGIDDGAQDLEHSLDMLKHAAEIKISTICVTPHFSSLNVYAYKRRFAGLLRAVRQNISHIQLYQGMEYRYTELLKFNQFLTLAGSSYILVDFIAPAVNFDVAYKRFAELQTQGYRVVVAHPERIWSCNDLNALAKLMDFGAVMQINAGSFIGVYGREIQQTADIFLRRGLCQVVASDAHGTGERNFFMREAQRRLLKSYSFELVDTLFRRNPQAIICNRNVQYFGGQPGGIRAYRWWRAFNRAP